LPLLTAYFPTLFNLIVELYVAFHCNWAYLLCVLGTHVFCTMHSDWMRRRNGQHVAFIDDREDFIFSASISSSASMQLSLFLFVDGDAACRSAGRPVCAVEGRLCLCSVALCRPVEINAV